jgi:hypothetical protein
LPSTNVSCDFMEIPISIRNRVSWAIKFSWDIVQLKIGNDEIRVNKEASLQLYYASILKEVLSLLKFSPIEQFYVELEASVTVSNKPYLIDILVSYSDSEVSEKHAIELKCYRTLAASGKNRGANDIFMHSVYVDLHLTEQYVAAGVADLTTCLILTDYQNFVLPKKKTSKNWTYDISHDYQLVANRFTTPIGGKSVDFNLHKNYHFLWTKQGNYWSTILRPI